MSFALLMPSLEIRIKLFLGFALVALALTGVYLYLLNETIRSVVRVEDAQRSLSALSSSVGDLEARYLSARVMVNLGKAKELGFAEARRVDFLSRSGAEARLSLLGGGVSAQASR